LSKVSMQVVGLNNVLVLLW